jgi:hypothetical protein
VDQSYANCEAWPYRPYTENTLAQNWKPTKHEVPSGVNDVIVKGHLISIFS